MDMEFLVEYGMFLAKAITIIASFGAFLAMIVSASHRKVSVDDKGELTITALNDDYEKTKNKFTLATLDDAEKKVEQKKIKAQKKLAANKNNRIKKRVFVVNFNGDLAATEVDNLREEITAILSIASKRDEVVVRLESSGGMVQSYGLASSQLDRIRKEKIKLTVCVDKVAASGGYMMACVGDKILAAPFAIIGSIGVVAQMPNFNRFLKKHNVDFELLTAGEHKRTLTMFGKNTEKGRQKFIQELNDIHELFKDYVSNRRSKIDIDTIASGEVWFGSKAKDLSLIDEISTSDEYLSACIRTAKVFEVVLVKKKTVFQRIGNSVETSMTRIGEKIWSKFTNPSDF